MLLFCALFFSLFAKQGSMKSKVKNILRPLLKESWDESRMRSKNCRRRWTPSRNARAIRKWVWLAVVLPLRLRSPGSTKLFRDLLICLFFNNEKTQSCGLNEIMIKYYVSAIILQLFSFPPGTLLCSLPGTGGAVNRHITFGFKFHLKLLLSILIWDLSWLAFLLL